MKYMDHKWSPERTVLCLPSTPSAPWKHNADLTAEDRLRRPAELRVTLHPLSYTSTWWSWCYFISLGFRMALYTAIANYCNNPREKELSAIIIISYFWFWPLFGHLVRAFIITLLFKFHSHNCIPKWLPWASSWPGVVEGRATLSRGWLAPSHKAGLEFRLSCESSKDHKLIPEGKGIILDDLVHSPAP